MNLDTLGYLTKVHIKSLMQCGDVKLSEVVFTRGEVIIMRRRIMIEKNGDNGSKK